MKPIVKLIVKLLCRGQCTLKPNQKTLINVFKVCLRIKSADLFAQENHHAHVTLSACIACALSVTFACLKT